MNRLAFDPIRILTTLSQKRAVFHSESDLQHAFAWELQRSHPEAEIRLEVPVRAKSASIYLDLLARFPSHEIAIELKYKTRKMEIQLGEELYSLKSHAAQDLGRYDFFKDITRIEAFSRLSSNKQGVAIFLTNDSAYWKAPTSTEHGYSAFAMSHERDVEGVLEWELVEEGKLFLLWPGRINWDGSRTLR